MVELRDDARIAVVGAGMAGLTCARRLADAGYETEVFDKARGPGGRMATRRADWGSFDHGAQYFTARDPRFQEAVNGWRETGQVADWQGRIVRLAAGRVEPAKDSRRFVGVPRMSALTRFLAEGLTLHTGWRVTRMERLGSGWELTAVDGRRSGGVDAIVLALPAPQAAELLDRNGEIGTRAAAVRFAPCWAVMVRLDGSAPVDFDAAFVEDSALSWFARNASKPGREPGETWVLHGGPDWSREHLEADPERVTELLLSEWRGLARVRRLGVEQVAVHLWRFALPLEPLPDACLFDPEAGILACGDWCAGPRVEGAFLSGLTAFRQLAVDPG